MSQESESQIDIEEVIMEAVCHIGGCKGASVDAIEKYLLSCSSTGLEMPDLESIHSHLNNAVNKGLLRKLADGKYIIKKAKWNCAQNLIRFQRVNEDPDSKTEKNCDLENIQSNKTSDQKFLTIIYLCNVHCILQKAQWRELAFDARDAYEEIVGRLEDVLLKLDSWKKEMDEIHEDIVSKLGEGKNIKETLRLAEEKTFFMKHKVDKLPEKINFWNEELKKPFHVICSVLAELKDGIDKTSIAAKWNTQGANPDSKIRKRLRKCSSAPSVLFNG